MEYLVVISMIAMVCSEIISYENSYKPAKYKRVCYYTKQENLKVSLIDAHICTHIIYGFARFNEGVLKPESPTDYEIYQQLMGLKKQNPALLVMISSATDAGVGSFDIAIGSPYNRSRFVTTSILYAREYGFDGIDLDWEFPTASQKDNVTLLVQELRKQVINESMATKRTALLLSFAVASVYEIIEPAYDIPELSRNMDFLNVMCYDYHTWEPQYNQSTTGNNSPLCARADEHGSQAIRNTIWSMTYWYQHGAPKEKLVVGIPTYGHTFTLADPTKHGYNAKAIGMGKPGPYGKGAGVFIYPDICDFISKGGKVVHGKNCEMPYAYNGTQWVGYDDERSVIEKCAWIMDEGLGGAMTWNLNLDDWQGVCGIRHPTFPLHRAIQSILG